MTTSFVSIKTANFKNTPLRVGNRVTITFTCSDMYYKPGLLFRSVSNYGNDTSSLSRDTTYVVDSLADVEFVYSSYTESGDGRDREHLSYKGPIAYLRQEQYKSEEHTHAFFVCLNGGMVVSDQGHENLLITVTDISLR